MGAISGTSSSLRLSDFCSSSTIGFIQSMNMSTLTIMYSMSIQLYLVTLEQLREASLFY